MKVRTIKLMDVVNGTSTNADGFTLFTLMDKAFSNGEIVKLSLENATPFASSFLNSSFGELMDKYGIEKIREQVKLTKYTRSRAMNIKEYLDKLVATC